jgi:hypothetical protein
METGILSYDNNVTVTDNHDGTITVAQGPGFGVISGLGTYVVGDWFMRGRGSKISDATFTSVVLPGMQEVPSESGLSWVIVEDS